MHFLQTTGGEVVKLTRTYGSYPQCGVGFSTLDEELGLLSGGLTPRGEETLVLLASWMPIRASVGVVPGSGRDAGEQGDGTPCDPSDRGGSAGGV